MIQLAFEPAFDPFHAAFRVLRQMVLLRNDSVAIARVKVLDVYVTEPGRCTDIRLPSALKRGARLAASCQPPTYGRRPKANVFFNRMSPIQDAAIQTLVFQGLLDADAFSRGQAMYTEEHLSDTLAKRISKINEAQKDLMTFLLKDLSSIPFDGRNGLKDRTGLGEYRYDLV